MPEPPSRPLKDPMLSVEPTSPLAERTRLLALRLTGWPSVTGTADERRSRPGWRLS